MVFFCRCPNFPELDIVRLATARVVIPKLEDESIERRDISDDFIDDTDLDEEEEPHRLLLYQPYMELNLQPIISKPSRKQGMVQVTHHVAQQRKSSLHRLQRVTEDDMIYSEEDDGYSQNDMIDASAEGNLISRHYPFYIRSAGTRGNNFLVCLSSCLFRMIFQVYHPVICYFWSIHTN